MSDERELRRLVEELTEAFNRMALDDVMRFFTEDAVYDALDGKRAQGKAAVREAFEPQFRGDFGPIRFAVEDIFVDVAERKAMVRWLCHLEGRDGGWRGLDVLHFQGRFVKEKLTYTKAKVPLIER